MFENYLESPLTNRALDFATKAHKGQMRKGGGEYISHPVAVAEIVREVKKSKKIEQLVAAALTHDTVEDTTKTIEDIKKEFGKLVGNLVSELTSDPEQIKKFGKTKYLIDKMLKMSSWGLVIKLADRVHNTSDLADEKTSPAFRRKYVNETNKILDELENKRELSVSQKKLVYKIKKNLSKTLKFL